MEQVIINKILQYLMSFLSVFAIYLISILDELMFDVYIATKEAMCSELMVSERALYPAASLFQLGMCIGTMIFIILVQIFQTKRIMIICQNALIILLILSLFCLDIYQIMILRFLIGMSIGGIIISMNIFIKYSYENSNFNQYIATLSFLTCLLDAFTTKFGEFIAIQYGVQTTIISVIIMLAFSFGIFYWQNSHQDLYKKLSIYESICFVGKEYKSILCSSLLILLLIKGISEGALDLILNLISIILKNIYPDQEIIVVGNTIGLISIVSSIYVLIYSDKEDEEDNASSLSNKMIHKDTAQMLKYIGAAIVCIFFNPLSLSFIKSNNLISYAVITILLIVLVTVIYITNFFAEKILYASYRKNDGMIASIIILFESCFSFLMQYYGEFFLDIIENNIILYYIGIYLIILFILIILFKTSHSQYRHKANQ